MVEDDEINQYVATEILQREDIEVTIAHNGQVALDMVKSSPEFDVILMDINMPVMNGFDATRKIRQLIPYRHKPIIGLSANVLPEDLAKGIDAGMNATLSKPILRNELMHSLDKFLFGETPTSESPEVKPVDDTNPLLNIEGIDLLDSFLIKHPEILVNVLFLFADKYGKFETETNALLQKKDFESLRIMAHSLKSNLANLGMTKLSDKALKLEKACSDNHESCEGLLLSICPKLKKLVSQINAAREKMSAAT